MKKVNFKKLALGAVALVMPLALSIGAIAYLPKVQADGMPVAVKPILPDNQVKSTNGYYDLMVTPNSEQDIELEVANSKDKDVSINLEINPAYTSDNGQIYYTKNADDKDESMKYPISSVVEAPKTVSIPANGTARIKMHVKVPSEKFDGMILGAVRITLPDSEYDSEKSEADSGQSFSITNKFAYEIGIKLQESEATVKGDLELVKTFAYQKDFKNAVAVNLRNATPALMNQMSYDTKIYKAKSSEILHQSSYTGYRVAPNTNFNVLVDWENQRFQAGTYKMKMHAENKVTGQKWDFEQDFTISAEEAKKLNDTAIGLVADYTWLIIAAIIGALLLIIIIILIIILLKRRKKDKKEDGNSPTPVGGPAPTPAAPVAPAAPEFKPAAPTSFLDTPEFKAQADAYAREQALKYPAEQQQSIYTQAYQFYTQHVQKQLDNK